MSNVFLYKIKHVLTKIKKVSKKLSPFGLTVLA